MEKVGIDPAYYLAEGYEILESLGQGAYGKAYKALRVATGDVVVLKEFHAPWVFRPEVQKKLLEKLEKLQNFHHPNVVQIYQYKVDGERRIFYLVEEFVDGKSLAAVLERRPKLPLLIVIKIVKEVAKALGALHRKGLSHLNLHPANILISRGGEVKLSDATLFFEEKNFLTNTHPQVSEQAVRYWAPEMVLRPWESGPTSDIYALGMLFFHLLAGQPAHSYDDIQRVASAQIYHQLPPVEKFRPSVPSELKQLLAKMTLKSANQRFQSMEEVIEALEKLEQMLQEEQVSEEVRPRRSSFATEIFRIPKDKKKQTTQIRREKTDKKEADKKEEAKPRQDTLPESPSLEETGTFRTPEVIQEGLGLGHGGGMHKRRFVQLAKILMREGKTNLERISQLLHDPALGEAKSVVHFLVEKGLVGEEEIASIIAKQYGLPLEYPHTLSISPDVLALVPEGLAREHVCIPIRLEGDELVLAVEDPITTTAPQAVQFATGKKVKLAVAPRSSILKAIEQNYNVEKYLEDFLEAGKQAEELEFLEVGDEGEEAPDGGELTSPIIRLVQFIITQAIEKKASDIHIEPREKGLQVRYRIDGVLYEEMSLPIWLLNPLISRIKVISKLDIAKRNIPQDGRIRFSFRGQQIVCRVSILPTHRGEKAVLRLLDPKKGILSLTDLGLPEKGLRELESTIRRPQGMFLTTGPTGSGKSTTLYAIVHHLSKPAVNIITVEDPVEYELDGINQVQVHPKAGLTFPAVLRSILRQDPDIILIGEIRDFETAEIALRAAITGHLVLSTLHTNDAPSTVLRLLDLECDPFLVATSLELVFAQRLVRRLCPHCRELWNPPADFLQHHPFFQGISLYRPKGCRHCEGRGYVGRVGLFEIMPITASLREIIHSRGKEGELRQRALEEGMIPLWESAIQKVREGITSWDEVEKACPLREVESSLCPICRGRILPRFRFCPHCQSQLKVLCRSCGEELHSQWKVCPHCGTSTHPEGKGPLSEAVLIIHPKKETRQDLIRYTQHLLPTATILEAETGRKGVELLVEERPKVVFLASRLPDKSPWEILEALRDHRHLKWAKVFVLSSEYTPSLKEQVFQKGADDLLFEPIHPMELRSKLTEKRIGAVRAR